MTVNHSNLHEVFRFHFPSGTDVARHEGVRAAAEQFAHVIIQQTPVCADQQAAIRKVREAAMTANAAIALEGLV